MTDETGTAELCAVLDGVGLGPDDRESLVLILEQLAVIAEPPLSTCSQAALWRLQQQAAQDKPRLSVLPSTPGTVVDLDRVEF